MATKYHPSQGGWWPNFRNLYKVTITNHRARFELVLYKFKYLCPHIVKYYKICTYRTRMETALIVIVDFATAHPGCDFFAE